MPNDDLMLKYTTSSKYIKQLIDKYGLDSFEWEVRKTFDTPEQAIAWEKKVLKRCKVLESNKWLNHNVAGYIVTTEEGRKKISETHKGKPKTEEHRKNLSKAQTGKKRPWAAKNLPKDVSGENNGMFGKKQSDTTKQLIGEKNRSAQLALGDNHPMRKVEWTPERRKAMGNKSRGKKRPQYAIDAAAAKLRGQKRVKIHCVHCDRDIAQGWYHRHGDHCAQRP